MAIKRLTPILPTRPLPEVSQIEQVKPAQAVQPIYGFNSIQAQKDNYYKQQNQIETFLANYNDPTELNSYIDALTNREAVSKKFGDVWGTVSTVSGTVAVLSFAGSIIAAALAPFTGGASLAVAAPLAKVGAVAAIPSIPAAANVTVEKGIKPIVAGKPKEAGLNMLMNLGETMDFAANPVKGLVLEGPEGFVKATGLLDEGRVNYDYDTGFFLTDMLLELVSDPMNWIDFGAGAASKAVTKSVGEASTKQLVDTAVKTVNTTLVNSIGEISTEGAERITKKVSKTAAKLSKDLADSSFKNLTDEAKKVLLDSAHTNIQRALVNAIKAELPNAKWSDIECILKRAGRSAETGRFTRSALNQITDITYDTLATDIVKGVTALQHYSDTFQKFMTKGAMMTSGYGLSIEAVKNGWKGINAWMNNYTLSKLKKATVFDNVNGLDIKQYTKAKGLWDACYQYTTALTGEVSQRDINSFYAFMNQQLNRDKELISKILQDSGTPLKKATRLDAQFKAIYNCDFNQYIDYLKGIDVEESGLYKNFVDFAEAAKQTTNKQSYAKAAGASIKTGTQLFSAQSPDNIIKLQNNLLLNVQQAIKQTKKGLVLTDKFYTIKLNNAYVNAMLLNDPVVSETLMNIRSSQAVGNLLDRILADSNSLEKDVSATISNAVRTIKDAGASFGNINQLYNDIAGLAFKIKGVSSDDFKRYIIDQILGENKTVSELLAGFNNATMPALMNGLEAMLYESNFKFNDYPTLKEQIAGVYRRFLQAQEDAGIEMVGATIVQDFTKSVDDLIKALPDYADELIELAAANGVIRESLKNVKNTNIELLLNIFTDKQTIFNVANTRVLADAGLALKTVALKENIDFFDNISGMPGHILEASNKLGKRINHLKKEFEQYAVEFDKRTTQRIHKAYSEVKEQMLTNKALNAEIADSATATAFAFLKNTDNVYEQFAILNQYYKLDKAKDITDQFRNIVAKHLSSREYQNLINPANLLTTDFAWEVMAQSAWIAEKQFNETLINSITTYHNLSLRSRKITNDFTALRDLISTNKLDRPFMLQQERYIKVATKYNNVLQFFEEYYTSLFDKQIAEQQIENLRKVMLNFPQLSAKYSTLVDTLEKYWRGELTFEQDPKWMLKAKRRPDGTPAVDTFTPFWNAIQEMNKDIQTEIQKYNNNLFVDYQQHRYKFNKETFKERITKRIKPNERDASKLGTPIYYGQFDIDEWNARKPYKFDKEELARRKVPFDKEELARRKVPFDKEELARRKVPFDKEEFYKHEGYNEKGKGIKQRLKSAYNKEKEAFKKQYTLEELGLNNNTAYYNFNLDSYQNENKISTEVFNINGENKRVVVWRRSRVSDLPYEEQPYYNPATERIIGEQLTKNGKYITITEEYFNDIDYVLSRQQYRKDYADAIRVWEALSKVLLESNYSKTELRQLKNSKNLEALARKIATTYSYDFSGALETYVNEVYASKYKEILKDFFDKYTDDFINAYAFAQDPTQWGPVYEKRLKAMQTKLKTISPELQSIIQSNAKKERFYKTIVSKDTKDLQRTLGARNKRILSKKFEPTYQQLSKEFTEAKAQNQKVLEAYYKELQDINTPIYEDYIAELNAKNEPAYLDYIAELNAKNELIYEDYIAELNAKNEPAYLDYIAELEREKNENIEAVYQSMIDELNNKNAALYKQYRELRMDYTGATPWDPIRKQQELNKLINRATDQNSKGTFYNLFNLTPEQFNQELARRKRFITFKEDDISDKQLKAMFNNFKKSLNPEDVYHYYDTASHRHWFVLQRKHKVNAKGRQVYLNNNAIITPKSKHNFDEFRLVDQAIAERHPELTKHLNELEDDLELLTGSRLGDSQGEYFTQDTLQKIYDQMPAEVQKIFDIDEMLDKQFFESYTFNESVLGTMASKQTLGMYTGNMITNLSNALTQAQNYLKPKNEYVHTVFDSNFSLANPKGIYAGFSDNDLLTALQLNTDYKLVALVDDKKYGIRVREIQPTSIAAIQKAKELGAVIVPLQTYKDMYNVVNHRIGSTGMAKLWSRIMYAYKFGYLCRPGAWIRNWFDTNLKSTLEMSDEYSTYNRMAHNILDDIDAMKDFIELRAKDGVLSSQAIREYFGLENGFPNMSKHLTYEQYIALEQDFLSQGISGNIIQNLNNAIPENADGFETFKWLSGKILDPANKTEEYNRLAMYLYELDKGLDYTTTLSKLTKTHFDYSFKSRAEQLVELVFPFTTFSLRNYSYWIEMIEKHPWIARNYVHLMKPHWDFKDYTPEELATDTRVQNQIMYGQLKLAEFNDKVITFKANPSIQDALQMFSDPINNVYEKLAAPFATPLSLAQGEYTQPTNAIPVIGPAIQAARTMVKTKSPLPSAIGVSKAPRKTGRKDMSKTFRNKNYNGMNSYRDKQYRTPNYRKNIVYDAYATKGITRYRTNFYPIVDIAHDVKMSYSVNVASRIKNKIKTDVYQGVRYSLRLDANKFK